MHPYSTVIIGKPESGKTRMMEVLASHYVELGIEIRTYEFTHHDAPELMRGVLDRYKNRDDVIVIMTLEESIWDQLPYPVYRFRRVFNLDNYLLALDENNNQ